MFDGGRRAGGTFKFCVVYDSVGSSDARTGHPVARIEIRQARANYARIQGGTLVARARNGPLAMGSVYIYMLLYISLRAAFVSLAPRYIYRKHIEYIMRPIRL